jgi:hypothetical protein
MEMPDGNFYDIKIEDCPPVVYFDSFGNGHIGTWARENDTKWCIGYLRADLVKAKDAEIAELNNLCDTYQKQRDDEVLLNKQSLKRIAELEAILEARGE